jgi:hypothetical protein
MAISVTHTFVSPVADAGDPDEVGPDEWNAAHTVTGAAETATQIIAGAGLTGGGTLATDRTLDVGAGTGITVNANDVALTVPVAVSSGGTGQTSEAEAVGELIQALSADATPDPAADYVGTYDASADTGKKVLLNDLITATEAQIESVIDTLANLTSIQGRTVTLADAGANAFFGWDDVAGAYENLTASEALEIIKTVDGAGSGLDADLLDGSSSSAFAASSLTLTAGGGLTGTGDLTANRTFAVGAGTGITVNADDVQIATAYQAVGKQAIFIPASAMISRTTAGAAAFSAETGTNDVMYSGYDFDQSTDESVQFLVAFPKQWNAGTVTFRAYWTALSGSGTVEFELAGRSFANDDALDQAFGTPQAVSDTLITAADVHVTSESSAITITSAADDELQIFNLMRDVSDDTLDADARLIGIELFITTEAASDA